jgi:hypothetical protein
MPLGSAVGSKEQRAAYAKALSTRFANITWIFVMICEWGWGSRSSHGTPYASGVGLSAGKRKLEPPAPVHAIRDGLNGRRNRSRLGSLACAFPCEALLCPFLRRCFARLLGTRLALLWCHGPGRGLPALGANLFHGLTHDVFRKPSTHRPMIHLSAKERKEPHQQICK